jgi:hypothetical protein
MATKYTKTWKIYQMGHKICQKGVKWTKWPLNIHPNTRPWQDPRKFTQIGIFGLKTIRSGNPGDQWKDFLNKVRRGSWADKVQADKIRRIFAHHATVFFGQFFANFRSCRISPHYWTMFSPR